MYETTAPIQWTVVNNVHIGTFELEGHIFHIRMEPGFYELPDASHTYTFLNVAFSRVVKNKDIFDLTPGGPFTSKVLGIVRSGILAKINLIKDFDAVIFVARDNQEKRMSVYNKLAHVWAKNFGSIAENIHTTAGPVITIIMKNANDPKTEPFFDFLKTQNKY
jgi:hypothetical protein